VEPCSIVNGIKRNKTHEQWSMLHCSYVLFLTKSSSWLLLGNLWHTIVISGFHKEKTDFLTFPNINSGGCG
jgi:hypothetical protein